MHKLIAMLAVIAFGLLTFVRLGGAQSQWNEIVEAAKREGTVVVVGPQGNETREALTLGFQKKYPEIKVEHSSAAGAQLPPKLLAEQKAERYRRCARPGHNDGDQRADSSQGRGPECSPISSVLTAAIRPHGSIKNSATPTRQHSTTL